MKVTIRNATFDRVVYDEESDVLYLNVEGAGPAAATRSTVEGHAIRSDGDRRVIGITIVNAKWLLERDGEITLTERISASTLASALN